MDRRSPEGILVEDATRDASAAASALQAPELEALGFRRLGVVRVAHLDRAPPDSTTAVLYVARYGDAFAFRELLDEGIRLVMVTLLSSGELVETRVPAWATPEGTAAAPLDTTFDATTGISAVDAASAHPVPWLDALFDRMESDRVRARYADRPHLGVHRQLVEVDDPTTLWVSHRGLVRRVQAGVDEVVDHQAIPLCLAAIRRSLHVQVAVDEAGLAAAAHLADLTRNGLLALPAGVCLYGGLSWWVAGVLVGFCASAALGVHEAVRVPTLRPWLIGLVPFVGMAGWLTIGWGAVTLLLLWCLAAVFLRDALFVRFAAFVAQRSQQTRSPAPVPATQLGDVYR
ncbi:MAG: hypothetical protein H6733_17470 [Alphaproteobacteria bacterium]|nr:hypothetical protein [Alphaproteobacteria bacterium]